MTMALLLSAMFHTASAAPGYTAELGVGFGAVPNSMGLAVVGAVELRGTALVPRGFSIATQLDLTPRVTNTSIYRASSVGIRPAILAGYAVGRRAIVARIEVGPMADWQVGAIRSDDDKYGTSAFGMGAAVRGALELPIHDKVYLALASQLAWTSLGLSQTFVINCGWMP